AWLCKNSWGENWCNDGYFWISYYDKHCGQHPQMGAVSFQGVQPPAYDRIYYHDYHGWRDTFTECTEAFNVFVAAGQELLKAVSFFTAANDVTYTIRIYARFDGSELEIELATKSGVIEQIGFHTIELDEDIPLSPDDSFYVYLDLSGGGHAYDRTSEVPVLLGARYRTLVESSSNLRESFYKSGSVWYDLYEYNHSANFCLKALVVNNPSIMLILPEGAPGVIEPAAPTEIAVDIIDGNESYVPGTGMIHYRFDEGIYVSSPLTPAGGDTYLGTLPAVTCDAIPEFYFSGQGDGGSTVFSPIGAPDHFYEAQVGTLLVSIEDNFEEDLGWIVWNVGATSGVWERCVPLVTSPPYYSPFTDSDGSGMCYVTDNESDSDVNDGAVRLMSPTFDMSDRQVIRYDYYLYLSDEISGNDVLLIEINNTSGVGDWFEVDAHDTHGQWNWRSHQITASDITGAGVSLTSTMRIRFTINDADPQSIVEAGIDAFSVADIACEAVLRVNAAADLVP
ncbi:MAG: hypothetical protein KAT85_07090, partial [candidate division Zixibacteria bacterium]|nr:hypothetical protein [candidate division Zixibacteria bacterium]